MRNSWCSIFHTQMFTHLPQCTQRPDTPDTCSHRLEDKYQASCGMRYAGYYTLLCFVQPVPLIPNHKTRLINSHKSTGQFNPLKFPGWNVHTYTPPNSITDGPIANVLLVLCILLEILSRAHGKGAKKALMVLNLALLLVVFWVTARQAWQWKG